ncbi:MAG: CDP-glucose 4,6-dehydratase [Methanoregula sp.]|jgi:CDP-glucose 4,6-dehydratase
MTASFLNKYSGKKVLITGDTGFKGSWLAIWLLKLGARVTGFGLPPKTREDNFTVCGLQAKIDHIEGDIRDLTQLSDAIGESRPDFVFHLAAQALVFDSYRDPYQTFTSNVTGTLNVLEAIRKSSGIKAAVMVTSDKCYENHEWVHGYRETDPLGGRDPYSASKGAAEIVISSYIRSFFHEKNTPAVASVRAGNVIGGGDWSENRIIPDCIRSLRSKHSIELRNPDSVRPWQHVLEPLYGYLMLGSALAGPVGKTFCGAWNFGPYPCNAVTVEDLVKEIISQWGSGMYHIKKSQSRNKESGMLVLDINKAVHLLNWNPVLPLKKSLQFTIEEYRIVGLSEDAVYHQRSAHIDEYMNIQRSMG